MKKQTSISIGLIVAGCWLASGTAWAAQPIEPPQSGPQTGGIPQCQADLAECTINLTETEGLLQVCEEALAECRATQGQAFPATGQTSCWYFDGSEYILDEECTNPLTDGQDGDVKAGAELSYTETTYTVIDNNTQLEWMKQDNNNGDCASLAGSLDKDCTFTWDEAFNFVASLNAANHAGGGWRVPNVKELHSIVNYENVSPAVSAEFNTGCGQTCTVDDPVNACSCIDAPGYWSSTSSPNGPDFAWFVNFGIGGVGLDEKSDDRSVRAVRGGR